MREAPLSLTPVWRLRWLLLIVVIMAALTAGWPLANASISNAQPLAAGQTLIIGPKFKQSARITVGPGWSLLKSRSDPTQNYDLRHGSVDLSVHYVALQASPSAAQLWSGLRGIIRIASPGARPVPVENSQGVKACKAC